SARLARLSRGLEGDIKGVALAAKKSKRRLGGAVEPLTYVRAFYDFRERQELVRLDSCEVIESPMTSEIGYPRAVALGHVAELVDEFLTDHEASGAGVRLSLWVLQGVSGSGFWAR